MRQFLIYVGRRLWVTIVTVFLALLVFSPEYIRAFSNSFASWYLEVTSFTSERVATGILLWTLFGISVCGYIALGKNTPSKIKLVLYIAIISVVSFWFIAMVATGFISSLLIKVGNVLMEDFGVCIFVLSAVCIASFLLDKYETSKDKEKTYE